MKDVQALKTEYWRHASRYLGNKEPDKAVDMMLAEKNAKKASELLEQAREDIKNDKNFTN